MVLPITFVYQQHIFIKRNRKLFHFPFSSKVFPLNSIFIGHQSHLHLLFLFEVFLESFFHHWPRSPPAFLPSPLPNINCLHTLSQVPLFHMHTLLFELYIQDGMRLTNGEITIKCFSSFLVLMDDLGDKLNYSQPRKNQINSIWLY